MERQRPAERARVLDHDAVVAHREDAQPPDEVMPALAVARDRHLERPALLAEFLEAAPPLLRS